MGKVSYGGPKVKDTETFIKKAVWRHGDKYDYTYVVYENSTTGVLIMCPAHGAFIQKPSKHLYGRGCPQCGVDQRATKQRRSKEDFVALAKGVHGDRYDYSESDYQNVDQKVKIICPEHGEFYQTPHAHIFRKYKCIKCSTQENADRNRKTLDEFLEQAKEVHGDVYDYSMVEYKTTHDKVKIICPKHGIFEQVAKSHLNGHMCYDCAAQFRGWTHTQPVYRSYELESNLYIIKMVSKENKEQFIKIGLSLSPENRHKQIANESGYDVINLYNLTGKGRGLYETEREVLFYGDFIKHRPSVEFAGQSECLQQGQIREIIKFVENFYKRWEEKNV